MPKPCSPVSAISATHSIATIGAIPVTINSLPNELLEQILSKLTLKEKISVEVVSKKWSQVLKRLYCQQSSLSINRTDSFYRCSQPKHNQMNANFKFRNYISYHILEPILNRCPNLKSIRLENCYTDSVIFLWLVYRCPKLECLALINIYSVWDIEWTAVKNVLRQRLRHLVISDLWMKSQNLLPVIPFVEELILHNHLWPLTKLVSNFGPNIRKLSLIRCVYLKVETMRSLVAGNGKYLTHLTIDDVLIEDGIIDLIGHHLEHLEYLSIRSFHSTQLQPIGELKKLRQLELDVNIEGWTNLLSLTLSNVQYLTIKVDFSPIFLSRIEYIFPNLHKLSIKYWFDQNISNNFCFGFISKMKFLTFASINDNKISLK